MSVSAVPAERTRAHETRPPATRREVGITTAAAAPGPRLRPTRCRRLATFLDDNYLAPLHDLEFARINKSPGACSLEILVTPGQAYSIQASSDLETWEQLGVVTSDTGVAHFVDVNAPAGKRFYRALPR